MRIGKKKEFIENEPEPMIAIDMGLLKHLKPRKLWHKVGEKVDVTIELEEREPVHVRRIQRMESKEHQR